MKYQLSKHMIIFVFVDKNDKMLLDLIPKNQHEQDSPYFCCFPEDNEDTVSTFL